MSQANLDFEWYDEDTSQHTTIDPNINAGWINLSSCSNASISTSWIASSIQGDYQVYYDPYSKMEQRLAAIEERLGILNIDEHPDNKMLKKIYDKYKFTEKLIKGKKDE